MAVEAAPALAVTLSIVPLLAAALVTPGYVILFTISRFTTGRPAFASSLAVSSVYYVTVLALVDWGPTAEVAERVRDLRIGWGAFFFVVVVPLLIGVGIGKTVRQGWIYRTLRWLKLAPVHGIPSAWDWRFMRATEEQWITVHLKGGQQILALYDADCFVSTDPNERDLYLSNRHHWGEDGEPVADERVEGVLLKGDGIDRIDFHPLTAPSLKESS